MAARIITEPMPSLADSLHALYVARAEDWRRDHLGASLVGHECDRYLWMTFRWAANPGFDGRMLRLFDRGHREELLIIDDLRACGLQVLSRDEATGEQFRFSYGDFGGAVDGLVCGVPDAPKTWHTLEVKTMNAKQFAKLTDPASGGVRRTKPVHYAQCQVGMRGMKLERSLYVVVCKDNDDIYVERVRVDIKLADALIEKGQRIAALPEPPARADKDFPPCVLVSKDGTRWPCQFFDLCHGKQMPAKSCRTCVSAERMGAQWSCGLHKMPIDGHAQRAGCDQQVLIPEIVNAQVVEVDQDARRVDYAFADGTQVRDGMP